MIRIVRALALTVPLVAAPAVAGPKDTAEPEDERGRSSIKPYSSEEAGGSSAAADMPLSRPVKPSSFSATLATNWANCGAMAKMGASLN